MNVLLIEDEEAAAQRMQKLLRQLDPEVNILEVTDSIESTVSWLKSNPAPELIFSDIHLADGSSFEVFREVEVTAPIIFTTAFDQYALEAFKLNSIDYLLKPVKLPELEKSLEKWKKLQTPAQKPAIDYQQLLQALQPNLPKTFQKRLVIRYGANIKTVEVADIAYFFTQEKITFLNTFENKKLPVDNTLDELEDVLDPAQFFRINRQFIINVKAIGSMYSYSKSRVKIELNPPSDIETIVSTERSSSFKSWLTGK
ncbi:LytR/AlgR family response regulator transcription factor [Adhaeribacter soli]|uniref:Response regulator transcription factor n=1 Tax=Adhaeribacter soli TaxID=2607655 RepID=A0A5N1IX62_9BACT|nr:LytTR family DNA-binding domain-containing protein [Adhaeribacter soli]KAA9338920.1 response regulator transcription factor [Adhaeribacter soli]